MMSLKNIDEEVISITLSDPKVEEVQYLLNSNVLNNSEEKLLERFLECSGLYGISKIKELLAQLGITKEKIDALKVYDKSELFDRMCDLITKRRKEENDSIYKELLEDSNYDVMGEKAVDIINRRYQSNIQIKDVDTLTALRDYSSFETIEQIGEGISSGIDIIDDLTKGIPLGKVSTIVCKDKEYRHLYVNNLAYNTVMEGKNVLYISINYEKPLIYLEMVARHSCSEKFNKPLSKTELTTKFDEKLYSFVYEDVYDQLNNHFIVYDIDDFNMQNVFVFQRIFVIANKRFTKLNNKPIDLIIVDGLEKLHIDRGRKVITNRNSVESEYYLFFKDMAKNFIGTNNKVAIVVTNESLPMYNQHLEDGVYYNLSFISDTIKNYSELILAVYGDKNLDKQKMIEVSLLKFANDNKVDKVKVRADKEFSLIHYKIDGIDEPANSNVYIKRLIEEKTNLEQENKDLKDSEQKANDEVFKLVKRINECPTESRIELEDIDDLLLEFDSKT